MTGRDTGIQFIDEIETLQPQESSSLYWYVDDPISMITNHFTIRAGKIINHEDQAKYLLGLHDCIACDMCDNCTPCVVAVCKGTTGSTELSHYCLVFVHIERYPTDWHLLGQEADEATHNKDTNTSADNMPELE